MSVVETAAPVTLNRPRPVSPRFLRSELWLIFGRRRNWAGMAVLAAVPVLIAVSVKVSPPRGGRGGGGPKFFGTPTCNWLFLALAALPHERPLFLRPGVGLIAARSMA